MPDETCPSCGVGQLKPTKTVYVQIYAGTLVSVPNVPAWVCDVCRLTLFDSPAIERIEFLIGESGPPPNQHVAAPPSDPAPVEDADEARAGAEI